MRCAICDKVLEPPIKIDLRTGKLEPCTECMEVINDALKIMKRRDEIFEKLLPTITTDTWEMMTCEEPITDTLRDNDIMISIEGILD